MVNCVERGEKHATEAFVILSSNKNFCLSAECRCETLSFITVMIIFLVLLVLLDVMCMLYIMLVHVFLLCETRNYSNC